VFHFPLFCRLLSPVNSSLSFSLRALPNIGNFLFNESINTNMKKQLFFTLFLLTILNLGALEAQTYNLVKDIFAGSSSAMGWSDPVAVPSLVGTMNQKLYFLAEGSTTISVDLWETDGTEAGTVKLLDEAQWTQLFVPEEGKAFLSAEKLDDEWSLYEYDGANLVEVAAGLEYGAQEMTYFKDKLYYVASVGSFDDCLLTPNPDPADLSCVFELESPTMNGVFALNEDLLIGISEVVFNMPYLFRSDGTTAGSENFYDLGANSGSNWSPAWIHGPDGKAFFFYQPGGFGTPMGLYITDGTEDGTEYLADLTNDGIYPKKPRNQIFYNGLLYVGGEVLNSGFGRELYISDGTSGGTTLLKDLYANGESEPNYFTVYNNLLYFVARGENGQKQLFRTDGTEQGTFAPLASLFPGSNESHGDFLTVYDGKLAFVAGNPNDDTEVWLSDGTVGGTAPITNSDQEDFTPEELFAIGNNLYFTGYEEDSGRELYVYNNGQPNPTLSGASANINCNDNQTPTELNDDFIVFELNVDASLLSSNYIVEVENGTITPETAAYGAASSFSLQAGSAGAGDVTVTIIDAEDPTWRTSVTIEDPGACSTPTDVVEIDGQGYTFSAFPNPFQETVNFQLEGSATKEPLEVQLFDLTGKQISRVLLNQDGASSYQFQNSAKGMFFYRLVRVADGEVLTSGKITGTGL
jgi:ELWxxDGT repeat protein